MTDGLSDRLRFELELHRRAGLRRLPFQPAAPELAEVVDSASSGEARAVLPILESPAPAAKATSNPSMTAPRTTDEPIGSAPSSPSETAPLTEPSPLSIEERATALEALANEVRACQSCGLCEQRNHAVPGEGCLDPPILFIGEGPGADEDRTGRPFVGRAGQLLDKMIAAIGLQREQVYIANIVKCRPPGNRTPLPTEVGSCLPYLERQLDLLRPKLICTLGLPSTRTLLPSVTAISAVRGKEMVYQGLPLVPTFHPAYLLRKGRPAKVQAWADMKLIARLALGKIID